MLCRMVALCASVVAGLGTSSVRASPTATGSVLPSALPTHFGLGVTAQPDSTGIYGWMPNSGIPWDYAYQYLAGGVNTGSGWETWNSNAQFPLLYAQGASSHHYIPVFPYYDLLQSNGTCGSCGEAQKDLSDLNNASLMASYYANFRLLMQRLGPGTYNGIAGFGKTAIVHIEPDLSGYAQQAVLDNGNCYGYCSGQGNNPALLKAAVASSGDPDAASFPNTYQGFNWMLLHLRDEYAPNVLLAFHISDWSAIYDVGSDPSTTLDAASLGNQVGTFAGLSGVSSVPQGSSSYDLLFNDVADRDAAYYKYVYGAQHSFWDRLNVTYPNFHRWETFIKAASQATNRSVIVWQIPEGNQHFDSENNTNGHYQDNRAEYFFSHIPELVQSGVIGLLFGLGNSGSTTHTDAMADGITNPAPICNSDGLSSGQICNNHISSWSDDDGGYIRIQAAQYYQTGGYSVVGTPQVAAVQGTDNALWVFRNGDGFRSLGGALSAAPAVALLPAATTGQPPVAYYVANGVDHNLWVRTDVLGWQRLTTTPTYCIDNPAVLMSGVAGNGSVTVACEGSDHALYVAYGSFGANGLPTVGAWTWWSGWLTAGPALVNINGKVTAFANGGDSRIYQRTSSTGWSALRWPCKGHPAASAGGGTLYFACHGWDNALWYSRNTGSGWSSLASAGGSLSDGPGIAASAAGATVFVEGSDMRLWQLSLPASGAPSAFTLDGGSLQHGAAAAGL